MAVSTTDIGNKLGYSQQTVSYILNNRWQEKGISEKTRDRVIKAARELNYRPNRLARGLLDGKTDTLGVIIPTITFSFWPQVVRGIEEVSNKYGYQMILCHSNDNSDKEAMEINVLVEKRIDGLIIAPSKTERDIEVYQELEKQGVSFVFINEYFEELETSYVITDDTTGAYEAVNHLIRLGHRRIVHLVDRLNAQVSQKRMEGYKKALFENNIIFDGSLVKEGAFGEETGYATMKQFLEMDKRPTAIFSSCDEGAVGAMRAIKEAGLRVPEDIAVVGFGDDIEKVDMFEVPLTTVRQPAHELGKKAAEVLLDTIEGKNKDIQRIILPTELVIRKSCGAHLSKKSCESAES